ncbi:MAG: hypothetical protein ABSC17_09780 [Thermacetogeniaceae bacterium]
MEPIKFLAVLPSNLSSAIKIDGDENVGGRVVFDVPGTDIAPLISLTMLRGKRLSVTVEEIPEKKKEDPANDSPF